MPTLAMTQSAANSLLFDYGQLVDFYLGSQGNLGMGSGNFGIEKIKGRLEQQKKEAEEIAIHMYNALGYTGSLEEMEAELNNKIKELQEITFVLNGPDLEKTFISEYRKASKFEYSAQKDFQIFLDKARSVAVQNQQEDFMQVAYKMLEPEIASLQGTGRHIKGRTSTGMLYTEKGYKVGIFDPVLAKCSKEIKEAFTKFKKNHEQIFLTSEEIGNDNLSLTFNLDDDSSLVTSFFKMSKEERENFFASHSGFKEKLNLAYMNEIINSCKVTGSNEFYLRVAITRVLSEKEDVFFVGKNAKDLTGILGEIQALFYMLVITNGKENAPYADWIGGIGSQKPHTDVLLKLAAENFGIQVKNTTSAEGAKKEIEFQSFGISGWNDTNKTMQYVSKGQGFFNFNNTKDALKNFDLMGLPGDLAEAIQSLLLMDTFNVMYNWEDGVAKEGTNSKFQGTRNSIEGYAVKCQQVMVSFIVSMMYMQVNNLSNGNSNILYIIAGTTAVSAATILSEIINELDNELSSFRMSMKTGLNRRNGQTTIVDVINDRGMSKKDKNYDKRRHLGNLHFSFQSAYTFA